MIASMQFPQKLRQNTNFEDEYYIQEFHQNQIAWSFDTKQNMKNTRYDKIVR